MGQKPRQPYKSITKAGGTDTSMGGIRRVGLQAAHAPDLAQSAESQTETAPLNVVRMTPPVEATLRILLNSVPYLIGAAVVRQPAVGEARSEEHTSELQSQ